MSLETNLLISKSRKTKRIVKKNSNYYDRAIFSRNLFGFLWDEG